ncbi:CsbD family protein [Leuconostocaceae bacterium ESL0723]|nr:CsbD family protein [Leuconostocaceae bacterium ESL0723]
MKNFLLAASLLGNAALAYYLFKDEDAVKDLREKADAWGDQLNGKAQQLKGSLTGNNGDKLAGDFDEAKGRVEEGANNLKNQAKDAADDAKEQFS